MERGEQRRSRPGFRLPLWRAPWLLRSLVVSSQVGSSPPLSHHIALASAPTATILSSLVGVVLRFIPGLGTPTGRYLFSDEADFEVPDDFPAEYKDVRGSETTEENGHHTVNSKM